LYVHLDNQIEDYEISKLIRLGYVECNHILKSQNGGYFISAPCKIAAGEVIVITPWILRLIEDYIVNNEEEFK
jgi:hypothetical protein